MQNQDPHTRRWPRRLRCLEKGRPMQHGNGDTIPIQSELPIEQPIPITKG